MPTVAIVGAGLIGRSWAVVFARSGFAVRLTDIHHAALDAAPGHIAEALRQLETHGLVADIPAILARIRTCPTLAEAVEGVDLVQENGPETVEAKRALFAELDALCGPDTILASSTSAIVASLFTEGLAGRARCLVGHPVNPPHLVPVVELCGAPWTDPAVIERARALYEAAGQAPVTVNREVEGFVLNRLQGALLSEAFRLVAEGVVSPADLDRTVAEGLGCAGPSSAPSPPSISTRRAASPITPRAMAASTAGSPPIRPPPRCGRPRAPPASMPPGAAAPIPLHRRSAAAAATRASRRSWRTSAPNPRRNSHGQTESRHHLRRHRRDPHPLDVAAPAGDPRRDRRGRDRRGGSGAAIVHLHARDPKTGKPDQSPEAFEPFLKVIKQRSNCVVNLTTGGAPTMGIDERLGPAAHFKPEVASLNMGSMNFGLYPMLERFKTFQHDWEQPYLEGSRDRIFKNTFADIEHILTTCAENGTRFEVECYDIGHLYTLSHFADRGVIKPPFFVQSVFGILGGIGQHPEDVQHMKRTADRLFGADYRWSVLGRAATR